MLSMGLKGLMLREYEIRTSGAPPTLPKAPSMRGNVRESTEAQKRQVATAQDLDTGGHCQYEQPSY